VKKNSDLDDLKDFYARAKRKRFKVFPNKYVVDRWLINGAMLLLFAWLFFVAHSFHYDLDYFKCEGGNPYSQDATLTDYCKNPFYKPVSWKNSEFLPPGEYGYKPGRLFQTIYYFPFLFFGIAFLINHLLFNRRKKK